MRKASSPSKPDQVPSAKTVRASSATPISVEQASLCCLLCVNSSNVTKFLELSCVHSVAILAIFPREKQLWEVLVTRYDYDTYLSSEEGRWELCAEPSRIALQSLLLRRYGNDHPLATSFYEHYWMNLASLKKVEAFVGLLRPWFRGFRIGDQKFERRFLVFYEQTDTASIDLEKIRQTYNSRFST